MAPGKVKIKGYMQFDIMSVVSQIFSPKVAPLVGKKRNTYFLKIFKKPENLTVEQWLKYKIPN